MINFNNEDFKKHMLIQQYIIPERLMYLSKKYPHVRYNVAKNLYIKAVKLTLKTFAVSNIADIPYGKGYVFVNLQFEEYLIKAERDALRLCKKGVIG